MAKPRCRNCGESSWTQDGRCKSCDEFPTLGWLSADWMEARCAVPDRDQVGEPFILTDEQLRFTLHHYRVNPHAKYDRERKRWRSVWHYNRGSQLTRSQKWGKGPFSGAFTCNEAAGPAVFDGWDASGQPVGRPWPTPIIQITALSEDQTDNVWMALLPMIELGDFEADIPETGKLRIFLPGGGMIEPVTSSARSRLGQRVTFLVQDQALALDTPLPTPHGWTTMGSVNVGDVLLGADGLPVRVKKAAPVRHDEDCYRVTMSDGSSVVASDGHLWQSRPVGPHTTPRTRTTGEMFRDGRRFRIPAPRPWQLPEADFPADPYLLGLWLGDGRTGGCSLTAGDQDVDAIRRLLSDRGITTKATRYGDRAWTVSFSSGKGFQGAGRPEVAKRLAALPCYRDKHIPPEYLRGSIEQRTELLRGLMDSDGSVTKSGHCSFIGCNERLVDDVAALLRTLGQVVRPVWRDEARYTGGRVGKINFCPRGDLQPFALPRKACRVRPARRGPEWVTIQIEPTAAVPVRCVGVEAADHLFLAGPNGHVTHNTESWVQTNGGRALADNQRRNIAGMGGRWMSTCNAWDPTEESVAQYTAEVEAKEGGVYLDDVEPPEALSIRNKAERRRALKHVYGDSWWVDLDRIDAEIRALLERDPAQAERFFLNRKEAAEAKAFNGAAWDEHTDSDYAPQPGSLVVVGVDGARFVDALALIATEVSTGFQWPLGIWERPKDAPTDYEHPMDEVDGAMLEAFEGFDVWRTYVDPGSRSGNIEGLLEKWQGRWGEKRVIPWYMHRPRQTAVAVLNYADAIAKGDLSHSGDPVFTQHVKNAVKRKVNVRDDDNPNRQLHVISKDREDSPRKIDGAAAGVLSWEARGDAIAENAQHQPSSVIEETPQRPDPTDTYTRRVGDFTLRGERYRDRESGPRRRSASRPDNFRGRPS